jgi:hypothetical protein
MAYRYSYDDEEKVYTPPKLKTDRSMWKLMLLNILTLGIYSIVFFMPFSYDLDKIAPTKVDSYVQDLRNSLEANESDIILPFSSEKKIYTDEVWNILDNYIN